MFKGSKKSSKPTSATTQLTVPYQGLLLPDTAAGEIEPSSVKSLSEVQPLSVGVEHIDGGIVRHDLDVYKRQSLFCCP